MINMVIEREKLRNVVLFVYSGHRQARETLEKITKNTLLMYRRINERHKGLKENRRELRETPERTMVIVEDESYH